MLWVYLAILAPALWALTNVLDKVILGKYIKDPLALTLIFSILHGFVGILLPFIEISFSWFSLLVVVSAGVFYFVANFPYYMALELEDASTIVPLWNFIPLLVLLISYFAFGEILNSWYLFSFLLIFLSSFLVTGVKGLFSLNRAHVLMWISCLFFSFSIVLTDVSISLIGFWQTLAFGGLATGVSALITSFFMRKRLSSITWTPFLALFCFGNYFLMELGVAAFDYALVDGITSMATVIASSQGLFALLFGFLFTYFSPSVLTEDLGKGVFLSKLVGGAIMIFGVALLYV